VPEDRVTAAQPPAAFDLSGRVALVTGAGSPDGIGFATARLLGELGARVAVGATTGRAHERAEELERLGVPAVGLVADLTDPAAVADAVRRVSEHLGEPTVLVNNAGMTSLSDPALGEVSGGAESGTLLDLEPGAWRRSLSRNLDTAFLVTRAVLPSMRAAGWGRVVMVASVTGAAMAMRGETAYAAAKAGMLGLARAVAVDHAGEGVTCNVVAPGWIGTASQTADEVRQGRATPAGRSGTPAEVAAAVAWLCTPGAGYTTGQLLLVDGGNSVAEERAPQPG
jgi:3-oxoacyl-[acyl-carrier protein] reductase